MAKAHDTWTVLPHGPIEELAENLWRVQGNLPNMPLKRVMTIVRRADGDLILHNPIALGEAAMAQIEAHGPVRYLVVPNSFHRLDSKVFRARYPQAQVICPSGARKRVAEVVPVTGSYADLPEDAAVQARELLGVGGHEGVLEVRSADGVTLVLNDVVFNMQHLAGFHGFVLRYVTRSSGGPRVSRIFRLFMMKDRRALQADLLRLAETPELRRVIVAHQDVISGDAAATLRSVAASLS